MKIKCDRDKLAKVLNKIGKVVESYKIQPAFSSLLVKASGSIITIEGSGSVSFLSLQTEGIVFEEGCICVRAYDFINVINNFTEGELIISNNEQVVNISNDNINISLEILDIRNFVNNPNISKDEIISSFIIDSKTLQNALIKCIPFADTTGVLAGVNFNFKENKTLQICCGTNRAISFVEIDELDSLDSDPISFTLNTKGIANIGSIFENQPVTIEVYNFLIKIISESGWMCIRHLQGKYPNMEGLLPKNFKSKLPILKEKFEQAFNLIDVVSDNPIANISYLKNICTISHSNLVNTKLELDNDANVSFKLDYALLRKIFKATTSEKLELLFNEVSLPTVLKEDNCTFLLGLMI